MIKNPFRFSILAVIILPLASPAVFALSTEERLQRLESMANNPVLLQLSQRVVEQQREIQRLQDEMDRLGQTNRFAIQQATKRYTETDQRINDLEEKLKRVGQLPKPALVSPVTATPSVPVQPPASVPTAVASEKNEVQSQSTELVVYSATPEENDQYQAAFALMRASKYDESIKAFEAFLAKNPASSLASNASYWAGEGYLINKEYNKALDAFNLVIERYPASSKVPDALLRAADSLMSINKPTEARVLYHKVLDEYPDTRAAKSADKRLN